MSPIWLFRRCVLEAHILVQGKCISESTDRRYIDFCSQIRKELKTPTTLQGFTSWQTPVYNVHYTMSINGKVQDGSMEIDAGNNLETFKTGSGSEEAVEVHDFQIVSTANLLSRDRRQTAIQHGHILGLCQAK
uniref:Uncharacterized protein n=1 Tax=Apteryx owenii TaxID=8824 RepID=A0A8B9QBV3_APTOW